jgi:hypothetical protein
MYHHLPFEITRIIFVFLGGYFPCQGRVIPLENLQTFVQKKTAWQKSNQTYVVLFIKNSNYTKSYHIRSSYHHTYIALLTKTGRGMTRYDYVLQDWGRWVEDE